MLGHVEIETRLPVWHALSEMFLDTELDRADYARIAAALIAAPYSEDQLRSIFEEEVAPAFIFNLLDVAGEWTPWSREEVRAIMLQSLAGDTGGLGQWVSKKLTRAAAAALYRRHLTHEWQKVTAALNTNETTTPRA